MADLVSAPQTGNALLIVLHIRPASKLCNDFGFIMEELWKFLDDGDIPLY